MSTEVKVPDIGDFKDVPVIEVHVKPGQVVKAEDTLITLESDKATMDVPAPAGGTVESVAVKVGDRVGQGVVILTFAGGASAGSAKCQGSHDRTRRRPRCGKRYGLRRRRSRGRSRRLFSGVSRCRPGQEGGLD